MGQLLPLASHCHAQGERPGGKTHVAAPLKGEGSFAESRHELMPRGSGLVWNQEATRSHTSLASSSTDGQENEFSLLSFRRVSLKLHHCL